MHTKDGGKHPVKKPHKLTWGACHYATPLSLFSKNNFTFLIPEIIQPIKMKYSNITII